MRVVLGEHQTNISSSVRREYTIVAYFNYEMYNAPGNIRYDYDISLVKLSQPAELNDDIQPICQPEANNMYVNSTASIMGWGTMRFSKSTSCILF